MDDADNLIYNRFDILYPDTYGEFVVSYGDVRYQMQYNIDERNRASLNVWGKDISSDVFNKAIEYAFTELDVKEISITSSRNNYGEQLVKHGDIRIIIPKDCNELYSRLSKKGRYNLKREQRRIGCLFKKFEVVHKHLDIDTELVQNYFCWKKITHGTDYKMKPEQYLKYYHVTDAISLKGDGRDIAVLFYCRCEDTVYLENFSYDTEYREYSPGFVIYSYFLEKMVSDCCKTLFLGKSGLLYKRRFDAYENECYSGIVYRADVFHIINEYLTKANIKNIAIYGVGNRGKEFLQSQKYLNVRVAFGIDKKVRDIDAITVYNPEDITEVNNIDCIIVCMANRSSFVESRIMMWGCRYLYIDELMNIGCEKIV